MRNLLNLISYRMRSSLRWSRGNYRDSPCGDLHGFAGGLRMRIVALQEKYEVRFERRFNARHCLDAYHYLDMLDRAFAAFRVGVPHGASVLDVGSKNFYYAESLHAFFRPSSLTGVEIDAYVTYGNLHSRYDYARFFIEGLPNTRYLPADFLACEETAQVICLFYPFVTERAVRSWGLPKGLLKPEPFFRKARQGLLPGGKVFMVNQGTREYQLAKASMLDSAFSQIGYFEWHEPLAEVNDVPVCSLWEAI